MFPLSKNPTCFDAVVMEASFEIIFWDVTWLKDDFRNLGTQTAIWVYLKRKLNGPKWSLIQFTVNQRNQLVRMILH